MAISAVSSVDWTVLLRIGSRGAGSLSGRLIHRLKHSGCCLDGECHPVDSLQIVSLSRADPNPYFSVRLGGVSVLYISGQLVDK